MKSARRAPRRNPEDDTLPMTLPVGSTPASAWWAQAQDPPRSVSLVAYPASGAPFGLTGPADLIAYGDFLGMLRPSVREVKVYQSRLAATQRLLAQSGGLPRAYLLVRPSMLRGAEPEIGAFETGIDKQRGRPAEPFVRFVRAFRLDDLTQHPAVSLRSPAPRGAMARALAEAKVLRDAKALYDARAGRESDPMYATEEPDPRRGHSASKPRRFSAAVVGATAVGAAAAGAIGALILARR